jgi:hypothetical protein
MAGFENGTKRAEAMKLTKDFFKGQVQLITLVDRSIEYLGPESDSQQLKFLVNIETLQK